MKKLFYLLFLPCFALGHRVHAAMTYQDLVVIRATCKDFDNTMYISKEATFHTLKKVLEEKYKALHKDSQGIKGYDKIFSGDVDLKAYLSDRSWLSLPLARASMERLTDDFVEKDPRFRSKGLAVFFYDKVGQWGTLRTNCYYYNKQTIDRERDVNVLLGTALATSVAANVYLAVLQAYQTKRPMAQKKKKKR